MKFTVKREKMINILTEFSNILKDNPIKPIVAGMEIKAENDLITFIGTNLDVNLIRSLEGKVEDPGNFVIKPNLLLEYIKLLDEEDIEFLLEDTQIHVHHATFTTLSGSFPIIMDTKPNIALTINGDRFVKALEKTKFAASQSTDNLPINCLRVVLKPTEMDLVSTDSYRLLYLKEEVTSSIEREVSIPMDTINILCKLLKDYNNDISIGFSGDILVILWENAYFSSKTQALAFPDYKYILANATHTKKMEFNKDELKSALRRVITVAKTSLETKFGAKFLFRGKILTINALSVKAKINQKVNMMKEGDDFEASLNCKFFSEYLENISDNPIVKGTDSGSMFEITESGNDNYKYILMPLAMR